MREMQLRASQIPLHSAGEQPGGPGLDILVAGSQDERAPASKGRETVQHLLKVPSKKQGHTGARWARV